MKKLQKLHRLLEACASSQASSVDNDGKATSANLSDYCHIWAIIQIVLQNYPQQALLIGLPMVLALHCWCETECSSHEHRIAIDHITILHFRDSSQVWECPSLLDIIGKV